MRSGLGSYLSALSEESLKSIEVMAPVVYISTVIFGTIFYCVVNEWSIDVSYYYATQVLLGCMYGVPEENEISQVFTLIYFVWGTSLLASFIAAMANQIISNTVKSVSEERRTAIASISRMSKGSSDDGLAFLQSHNYIYSFLTYIGWFEHKTRYIAIGSVSFWYLIGVMYGIYFEGWDIGHSSYCAISALSANGLCPPPCIGDSPTTCTVGPGRALIFGHYILIGVPLFAFAMAQCVGIFVEKAVRASEMKMLSRPLTTSEFQYAMELRHGRHHLESKDKVIDLGGFIVMELLRLRKIDQCDLDIIRSVFEEIDEDGNGVIGLNEMTRHAFLKNTDEKLMARHVIHRSYSSLEDKLEDIQIEVAAYNEQLMPLMSRLQVETTVVHHQSSSDRERKRSLSMGHCDDVSINGNEEDVYIMRRMNSMPYKTFSTVSELDERLPLLSNKLSV